MGNEQSLTDQKETGFRVSVIIPVHNHGAFLARAIDSVLNQSYPVKEIIVIDDGSTEDIKSVVQAYGQSVRYEYQKQTGPGGARNRGIEIARGDWIAFLDGDDEWLEGKIQSQIAILNKHKELMWCSGNYTRCFENGRRRLHLAKGRAEKLLKGKAYVEDYFQAYRREGGGHTNNFLIQRKVFEQVGTFRQDFRAEDVDLWWRIAMRWPQIGYVPEPISIYYVNRVNHAVEKEREAERLEIMGELVSRNLKLAVEKGPFQQFVPCGSYCLKRSIRGGLFYPNLAPTVRKMLDEHNEILGLGYRLWIRILTVYPSATAWGLAMISRLVRLITG